MPRLITNKMVAIKKVFCCDVMHLGQPQVARSTSRALEAYPSASAPGGGGNLGQPEEESNVPNIRQLRLKQQKFKKTHFWEEFQGLLVSCT